MTGAGRKRKERSNKAGEAAPRRKFLLKVSPGDVEVFASGGDTVLDALRRSGIVVDSPCGGKGACGKCLVNVVKGDVLRKDGGKAKRRGGSVLACRAVVVSDASLELAGVDSQLKKDIISRHSLKRFALEPSVGKHFVQMPEPRLSDARPDFARLRDALAERGVDASCGCGCLAKLPAVMRDRGFAVTAAVRDGEIINVEPGDTSDALYGAAVDLGTTSIAVAIVDLREGAMKDVITQINPQIAFGADVISRIEFAQERRENLLELQARAAAKISRMIESLAAECGISPADILEIAVSCNTVMNHFLLGLPAANIAVVPFVPATVAPVDVPAASLGITACPSARVWTLPGVSGYLGGDIVAGAFVSGVMDSERPALLVDLGTNSEIVAGGRDRMVGCSAAAGPAFEGGRISCGTRAVPGAIEDVGMGKDDIELKTVAGAKPVGVCGTGLVSIAAFMLEHGMLDETGVIRPPEEAGAKLPEKVARRICRKGGNREFVLFKDGRRRLSITQADVRELQLAKGALAAGIAIALNDLGVKAADLEKVLVAGAFGSYLNRKSALATGIFPPGTPEDRIFFIGNSSLEGAAAALVSRSARAGLQKAAERIERIELSTHPSFQDVFVNSMLF